ncbi:MAG: hypothetical protein IJ880_00605 [Bacilli bacterium]|nr:hypothetical protein [Bacilli bacterium]
MTIEEAELKVKEKTLENLIEAVSKIQSDKIVSEASFIQLKKIDITKLEDAEKAKVAKALANSQQLIKDSEDIIAYVKSKIKDFI